MSELKENYVGFDIVVLCKIISLFNSFVEEIVNTMSSAHAQFTHFKHVPTFGIEMCMIATMPESLYVQVD